MDTVSQVATGRIGETTVAIVLESTPEEAARLAEEVLLTTPTAVVVG